MVRGIIGIASVIVGAACASSQPVLPPASPDALGLDRAQLRVIDAELQAFVDSGHVSGIYAVIARHGRTGYERTFGWRDVAARDRLKRDDIFRIYSMTKPVIAAAVLRLVEDGSLVLDDPVSKYIPSFAHVKVFVGGSVDAPLLAEPSSPITVRMLLNHTSGLPYGLTGSAVDTIFRRARMYRPERTLAEFADSLALVPLLFHPGADWSYSSGFDVAGRVIEVASGQPLDEYLEAALFRPLGMRDTGFRIRPETRDRVATVYAPSAERTIQPLGPDNLLAMFEPDTRFFWGSGGLLATADDFLRFAQMLLNGGTCEGVRILSPASVALMTHNTLPDSLTPVSYGGVSDGTYGFGLGVAVRVDSAGAQRPGPVGIYRWSGYLGTYFWNDPVNDMVAMVWTQLSPGGRYPLEASFQALVYAALRGR